MKSARATARAFLATYGGPIPSEAFIPRPRRLSASGASVLHRRRRSSAGGGTDGAFSVVRDAYAGAIAASRRANATALLVAASDEAAELDWLQLARGSAAAVTPGSETLVRAWWARAKLCDVHSDPHRPCVYS